MSGHRTIPPALQARLDQNVTTTTRLLKIMLRNGFTYGLAMLDRDIDYDDGAGVLTYHALTGFDPSAIASDIGYSVDNAEGASLMTRDLIPGVTLEMVEAGDLDDAAWICYLVDFEHLEDGHILLDAGDLGEVRTRYGAVWIPELLSYMARLRQPIGGVWSRSCRAIFGSPADSQTGCGVDLAPLWVAGEVTAVGAEADRVFTGDAVLGTSSNAVVPFPGRVEWLTGANAGRTFPTEDIDGLVVSLGEPTGYPIEIGDTYRIRPDCRKRYLEDCIETWDNGVNFKGEPLIPVGDSTQVQVPGAELPGGGGWTGETPGPEGLP